jgi:transposase, IS5 family
MAAQVQGNELKSVKTLSQRGINMYRQIETKVTTVENLELKFEGKLAKDNRWVIMSELIPWQEFEKEYAKNFSETGMGAPAKPFRIALGALIIKERLGTSDRETVEQIRENPYLQYCLGIEEYGNKAPFEASILVHFRQRIGKEIVNEINRKIVERNVEKIAEKNPEKKSKSKKS